MGTRPGVQPGFNFRMTACIRQTGPLFVLKGKNFSHLTALATMQLTSGLRLGRSVVKFIFFHLQRFFIPKRGNPKSEPIEFALTKYICPSENIKKSDVLTLWLDVDVLGMLLLTKFLHVENSYVVVNVVEHVCVLVTAQPFLFPIESYRHRAFKQSAQILVIIAVLCRNKLARQSHMVLAIEI